ncbi:signal peptide protein [Rhodopirellula maiorica SM1]|uniref:Signal peptide protein n=2 Tax=Novipirellula TaxID=2795426 RepID=M5S092_9BACT|nr:signal peptide protein [Rhodopirellula maiorica SM1]
MVTTGVRGESPAQRTARINTARINAEASFRPTFRIDPLVFQCQAIPGQTVRFKFRLSGSQKPIDFSIQPVSLIQHRDGKVTAAETLRDRDSVRLLSSSDLRLGGGEVQEIEGTWTLPRDSGQFVSVGLLVTDRSEEPFSKQTTQRQLGVRFVTRYLLRLEADIRRVNSVQGEIRLTTGGLVDRDGFAHVNALLWNPHDAGRRLRAKARMIDAAGRVVIDEVPLGLTSRINQPEPKRFALAVLPRSEVTLTAALPEPVFPGDYQLQIDVRDDSDDVAQQSFRVHVGEYDFQAQRSVVGRVLKSIQVHPSAIELSTLRGGNRLVPLSLKNQGDKAVSIRVVATDRNGNEVSWLRVRPERVHLGSGAGRKLMVTMNGHAADAQDKYAELRLHAESEFATNTGSLNVPVAMLNDDRPRDPDVSLGTIEVDENNPRIIRLQITNHGTRHLAPHLIVTLTRGNEPPVICEAGYHAWLLPSESRELRFQLPESTTGIFKASIHAKLNRTVDPTLTEQTITLP